MKPNKQTSWYQIKAAADGRTAEIRIFGEIGWEVTAARFIDDLDALGDSDIEVRINSVGGSVIEGVHIYNRLLIHKGRVDVVIEGTAASMASVIAMAGNRIAMMEAGWFMIHNPSGGAWGDAGEMKKAAEVLDKMKDTLVGAYARKTGKSVDEISELMDEETWLSPAEALEHGFIDEVLQIDLDMAACAHELSGRYLAQFSNTPDDLTALLTETQIEEATDPKSSVEEPLVLARIEASINSLLESLAPHLNPAASAASPKGAEMLTDDQKAALKAAEAKGREAEVERRKSIKAIFNQFDEHADVRDTCLDDPECTADKAQERLLNSLREKNDREVSPTGGVVVVEDNADKLKAAAVNWLSHRAGLVDEKGVKARVTGDNPFRGMRLLDMARDAADRAGISTRGMLPQEIVAAAITHSTSDFPNLLQDAMHKTLLNGFSTAADTWRSFCATGDLSDFRPHYRHIMGSFSDLKALDQNGEIEDGTLDDTRKETITGSTKARILNLSHQAIVNDDMSVFSGAARMMGRAAARSVENDVFALILLNSGMGPSMSDATTLFHADHGNVGTGAPSVDAIDTALQVIAAQTLPNTETGVNEYVDLSAPPVFVGPLSLRGDMTVINEAQYDPDTSNKLQKPNKSRGLVGAIVGTPRLTGTPWYLFPDPNELPVIEVGFVQGMQEPSLVMEEAFRQYGVSWRVVYDYGVAGVNWLGAFRSTGA